MSQSNIKNIVAYVASSFHYSALFIYNSLSK